VGNSNMPAAWVPQVLASKERGLGGPAPTSLRAAEKQLAAARRHGHAVRRPRRHCCTHRSVARLARQPRSAGRWLRTQWLRGETATRRVGRAADARRNGRMARRPPPSPVPIPFTGIQFVLRSRLLRIPFEIRKESSGPLGIIRWSSFARYRDRWDCGGCRT
jgi:hypothetical protein